MKGSMASRMSHSCDPNCQATLVSCKNRLTIAVYTVRDVKVWCHWQCYTRCIIQVFSTNWNVRLKACSAAWNLISWQSDLPQKAANSFLLLMNIGKESPCGNQIVSRKGGETFGSYCAAETVAVSFMIWILSCHQTPKKTVQQNNTVAFCAENQSSCCFCFSILSFIRIQRDCHTDSMRVFTNAILHGWCTNSAVAAAVNQQTPYHVFLEFSFCWNLMSNKLNERLMRSPLPIAKWKKRTQRILLCKHCILTLRQRGAELNWLSWDLRCVSDRQAKSSHSITHRWLRARRSIAQQYACAARIAAGDPFCILRVGTPSCRSWAPTTRFSTERSLSWGRRWSRWNKLTGKGWR